MSGAERLNKLLEKVVAVQLFPEHRQLGQTELKQLVRILATISAGIDARELFGIHPFKLHSRGRPDNEYFNTWLAAHFLLRKKSRPNIKDKTLQDDIAQAWITTPGHVKKLVTKHRKTALALMARVGESAMDKALSTACQIRSGKIRITPSHAKARAVAMLCVFHLADPNPEAERVPKTD